MKKIIIFILLTISVGSFGQTIIDSTKFHKLLNEKLSSYNLSPLWMHSETDDIVGFIGSNYQRLQIHYFSITKDTANPNVYLVKGKSKAKENICDFEGTITVIKVEESEFLTSDNQTIYDLDTIREGMITASYSFRENQEQRQSGIFEGTLTTQFYIDKYYQVHYDDLELGADIYSNNQFKGSWASYNKKIKMTCNWGDNRIPDCGDLDVGVGEFVPNQKYIKNGWEGYCWYCSDEQIEKYQADKKRSRWWEN